MVLMRRLAATCAVAFACGAAFGQDFPGELREFVQPGRSTAAVNDLVVVSVPSSPLAGPAKLKVEVRGKAPAARASVVFVPAGPGRSGPTSPSSRWARRRSRR